MGFWVLVSILFALGNQWMGATIVLWLGLYFHQEDKR
jgi:hypothetical protein